MATKPYVWKQAKNIDWFPGINKNTKSIDMGSIIPGGWVDPVSGGTGVPGNRPGARSQANNPYTALLNNLMNQGRNDIRSESVADAAGRDAAIRRLLISYGETPDLNSLGISSEASGVLGGVLDEKTRGLASQNTAEGTSVKARLDAANKEAQAAIPRSLAGRGMFRSGETGAGLAKQAMTDKQARFDTLNEMLGNVESAVGGYAANERQRQRQLADMEAQNMQRQWEIWNATQMGGGDAGPEPPGGGGGGGGGTQPNSSGPYGGVPLGAEVVHDPQRGMLVKFGGEQVGYIDVNGHYRPLLPGMR